MIEFSAMVGLVIVVAQIWKKIGLSTELIPLLNVCIAVVLSLIFFDEFELSYLIQQGILIGLSASGIYDVGKCFMKTQ